MNFLASLWKSPFIFYYSVSCNMQAQKISFNILRKLVEFWGKDNTFSIEGILFDCLSGLRCLFLPLGGSNGLNGFGEFIYKSIVPASFMAPMKSTFDLNDAQTILVCKSLLFFCIVLPVSVICGLWLQGLPSGHFIVKVEIHLNNVLHS